MTDQTPEVPKTPRRTPAAKSTAAPKTPVAPKAPAAAKAPATAKAPVAPKTPAVRKPAAKKLPVEAAALEVVPVEPVPAVAVPAVVEPVVVETVAVAPVAATAPAGWYPASAGSAQQRWWDGMQWTDHVYDPPAAVAAPAVPLVVAGVPATRAPAGTRPGTVWFWLLAVGVPVLQLLELIPGAFFVNQLIGNDSDASSLLSAEFSPSYLVLVLCGWFIYAVCIVFAVLDYRELRHRGVPNPFHWGWSFFVLLVGWPAVYMIGRTVIVKRRTGSGMAPLWVFIALQVVAFVVIAIVAVVAFIEVLTLLGNGLSAAGNVL